MCSCCCVLLLLPPLLLLSFFARGCLSPLPLLPPLPFLPPPPPAAKVQKTVGCASCGRKRLQTETRNYKKNHLNSTNSFSIQLLYLWSITQLPPPHCVSHCCWWSLPPPPPPPPPPPARKRSFCDFSPCLSRACLGKSLTFSSKNRSKSERRFHCGPTPRQQCCFTAQPCVLQCFQRCFLKVF